MNLELNLKTKNSVPLSGSSAQSTYCDALEVTLSQDISAHAPVYCKL